MDLDSFYLLGFTRTEAKLYLALLDRGKSGAQQLASRCNIPRSTAYSALDSLYQKELIQREEKRGSTFFFIESPDALVDIARKEKERAEKREKIATKLAADLQPLMKSSEYSVPRIEFVEGKRKMNAFFNDMLALWHQSMLKYEPVSTWGYQDDSYVGIFSDFIKRFWEEIHRDAGIPGRILSNLSETETKLVGQVIRREVRILDPAIHFNSSIWVLGDYIIMIMTRSEPYYAFQICDSVFAANLREVFQHLYNESKAVEGSR